MEVRNSRLTHAIDFTRSSEFEIDLSKLESIIRLFHCLQSIGLVFLRREEITIGLILSSTDAATELVELGESESLSGFDTHDGGIGIVHTDFYNRSRGEYVDLVLIEFLHDTILLLATHLAVDESDMEMRKYGRESDLHLYG